MLHGWQNLLPFLPTKPLINGIKKEILLQSVTAWCRDGNASADLMEGNLHLNIIHLTMRTVNMSDSHHRKYRFPKLRSAWTPNKRAPHSRWPTVCNFHTDERVLELVNSKLCCGFGPGYCCAALFYNGKHAGKPPLNHTNCLRSCSGDHRNMAREPDRTHTHTQI